MKLCMFCPLDHPMLRGWVGRIDGDRVIQLAAQTLQSLFTGGGSAREHAVYPLVEVRLLAPVLHPPAVRIFEDQTTFAFANPAAIVGPGAEIHVRGWELVLMPRIVGVVGRDGAVEGFTALAEWRALDSQTPKDRDFALGLGPVVVTADELDPNGLEAVLRVNRAERQGKRFVDFDWSTARDFAADGTTLYPGDLLAGPSLDLVAGISTGSRVELEVERIGVLDHVIVGD